MSKKEKLIKLLEALAESHDTEGAHVDADNALLDYINDQEIRNAYNSIHKWYA